MHGSGPVQDGDESFVSVDADQVAGRDLLRRRACAQHGGERVLAGDDCGVAHGAAGVGDGGHADIQTTLIYAQCAPNPNEVSMVNAALSVAGSTTDDSTDDKLSKSAGDSEQEDPANRT